MLPNDFPLWYMVFKRFERWNKRVVWEKVVQFVNKKVRVKQGRNAYPSYGQSVGGVGTCRQHPCERVVSKYPSIKAFSSDAGYRQAVTELVF